MQALLLLSILLCAAAPVGRVPRIQTFRAAAGMPPFDATKLGALNTPTLKWAEVQAAHDLLARVSPKLDVAPSPLDAPKVAELKALVAEARAVVAEARQLEKLNEFDAYMAMGGDEFQKQALDALYGGTYGRGGLWMDELLRDGAASQAAKYAAQLKLPSDERKELAKRPPSPAAVSIERRLDHVRKLVKRGDWTAAWAAAEHVYDFITASGLRRATRMYYGIEALSLIQKTKSKGAPRVYGTKGVDTGERVAVQNASDCAVHQLYNHPALAALAKLLPYHDFLRGVEKRLGKRVRSAGMADYDTSAILAELGFKAKRLSRPKDAAELRTLIERHGPLMISIRWTPPENIRDRHGDHAVLIKEARDGAFLVIDSNYARPQLLTFEALGLLAAGGYAAVVPVPGQDPAAMARSFIKRHVPPPAFWLRRLLGLD